MHVYTVSVVHAPSTRSDYLLAPVHTFFFQTFFSQNALPSPPLLAASLRFFLCIHQIATERHLQEARKHPSTQAPPDGASEQPPRDRPLCRSTNQSTSRTSFRLHCFSPDFPCATRQRDQNPEERLRSTPEAFLRFSPPSLTLRSHSGSTRLNTARHTRIHPHPADCRVADCRRLPQH